MAVLVLQTENQVGTAYYQFERGRDPLVGMSPVSRWYAASYLHTDQTASVVSIEVPPRTMVLRVRHVVATAFTGATDILVGDGDAANGWIRTGIITPGTAGDFIGDPPGAFEVAGGKYYAAGDTIDISFTGVTTAGTGKIFVEMISYHEALADIQD